MGGNTATFERRGCTGQLRIVNPSVNAMSPQTVAGLAQGFAEFEAVASLQALVVHCDGRTFVTGARRAAYAGAINSGGLAASAAAEIETD